MIYAMIGEGEDKVGIDTKDEASDARYLVVKNAEAEIAMALSREEAFLLVELIKFGWVLGSE